MMERAVVDLQRGRGRWAREGYELRHVVNHTKHCHTRLIFMNILAMMSDDTEHV